MFKPAGYGRGGRKRVDRLDRSERIFTPDWTSGESGRRGGSDDSGRLLKQSRLGKLALPSFLVGLLSARRRDFADDTYLGFQRSLLSFLLDGLLSVGQRYLLIPLLPLSLQLHPDPLLLFQLGGSDLLVLLDFRSLFLLLLLGGFGPTLF